MRQAGKLYKNYNLNKTTIIYTINIYKAVSLFRLYG